MRVALSEKLSRNEAHHHTIQSSVVSSNSLESFLLELCPTVKSASVLELVYGDSSIALELKKRGASDIYTIDGSKKIESNTTNLENIKDMTVNYGMAGVSTIDSITTQCLDLVVALDIFNDLDSAQTTHTIQQVKRILKPGGQFLFAVPHPFRAEYFEHQSILYNKRNNLYYLSSLDTEFENGLSIFEGGARNKRGFHKTVGDYFDSLRFANFKQLPEMYELMKSRPALEVTNAVFCSTSNQPTDLIFSVLA